jgi:di/tricarboxylate transporter
VSALLGRFRCNRLYLLVVATLAIGLLGDPAEARADADSPGAAQPIHLSIQGLEAGRLFVAGESGELKIDLSIASPGVRFDPGQKTGTLRLSAPAESGIYFSGAHQAVLAVDVSRSASGVVPIRVPYSVDSLVRVKNYSLQMDLTVPLVSDQGHALQDGALITWPVRVETPLSTKLIVLGILFIAIFLFVVEWVRVDVVAIMMMVSLPLLNLLDSRATFTGLSSNAVIAIIGVMIISAGLNKVGLVSRAVRPVIRAAGSSPNRLMVFLASLIAVISSVMQNTGAAVLFLPGIRHAAKKMKIPISRVLMPIGMCAILGGTLTMIGTSPLILLNDILPEGMEKFGLLDLTPIGFALAVSGILYFSTVGRVFLKKIAEARQEAGVQEDVDTFSYYHDLDGPFELRIPTDWKHPGGPDTIERIRKELHVNIVCIADYVGMYDLAPPPETAIKAGMNLCAYGPEESVKKFAEEYGIELLGSQVRFKDLFNQSVAGTVEAAVSPRSTLIGSTIHEIGFRRTFGVTVLAVYREGKTYYKELADIPLAPGDAMLLHSTWEHFHTFEQMHHNFKIITPLEVDVQKPAKATSAIVCFGIALVLMIISSFYFQKLPYNPIPLSVCLMLGALGMVVTRVLAIHEAYQAIDWRTVFLLGGLIPLGMAVDRTGTAEWIARSVVGALGDAVTPLVLIIVLAVLGGGFCLVISNVGACTLLVPLGASMAAQIGVDPRIAAVVVGLAVSNSFLLPTHQVNALYMGPGGYRTKDYMRIGGVMSLIYVTVLVTMTYLLYV